VYNFITVVRILKLFLRKEELNLTGNDSHGGTQEICTISTEHRPFEMKVPVPFEMSVNIQPLRRRPEIIFFTNNPTALLYQCIYIILSINEI